MVHFGLLAIADISGYTRFLTESELEHANEIISELLNVVTGAIQSPLSLSSVEGDAVFLYGVIPDAMTGQTVLDSVELLYCSFAAALETMVLNTTCTCNACANITTLGLKIVVHCGEFAVSDVGGQETVSGPDVIVAHRLLKNKVVESTGISDYMLVTQACVEALGVEEIVAGWTRHTEGYEFIGEVEGWVSSLPDIWAYVRDQNEDRVLEGDAWLSVSVTSEAPLAVVWDHLIDPIKRTHWLRVGSTELTGDQGGRIGPGTEYHCAHVEDGRIQVFTVLDMKTTDYVTFVTSIARQVGMRYTDYLIPSGSGTRIIKNVSPLFSTETGQRFTAEKLAEMKGPLTERLQHVFDNLANMAAHATAGLDT